MQPRGRVRFRSGNLAQTSSSQRPCLVSKTLRAPRRRLSWWWAPVLVLVLILVSLLFPWKLNFLRNTIAQKVEDGTGRSFAIDGDIWLYWLQGPRVTIDGLRLGNPAWASTPQMATIEHIDASVSLANLLQKRLVLKRLDVVRPVANLEEGADGKRNWYFDKQQSDSSTSIVIRQMAIEQGHVGYVVKSKDTDVQADLATLTGADVDTSGAGSTNGIGAKATGRWKRTQARHRCEGRRPAEAGGRRQHLSADDQGDHRDESRVGRRDRHRCRDPEGGRP